MLQLEKKGVKELRHNQIKKHIHKFDNTDRA